MSAKKTSAGTEPAKAKPAEAREQTLYLPPHTKEERALLADVYELIQAELTSGEQASGEHASEELDGDELSGFSIIGHDGKEIRMPIEVVQVLKKICQFMRTNDAVITWQRSLEIGLDRATKMLGVRGPEFVELVESGEISNVGTADDPLVRIADVLVVMKRFEDEWRRNWEISNQLEYEMGMYEKTATPMPARR